MGAFVDLTGQRVGKWRVLSLYGFHHKMYRTNTGKIKRKCYAQWNCTCDCGTERVVASSNLCQLRSRSCGCARIPVVTKIILEVNRQRKRREPKG